MKSNRQQATPFERIKQVSDTGEEFWTARDLAHTLGYEGWQHFPGVIAKAIEACKNSGQAPSDHFHEAVKMVTLGSGAERKVQDWELSRYACYLVVQNADPTKKIVALGQTYFAVQTRRAELRDEIAGKTFAQQRLYIRQQLTDYNKRLAAAAAEAGVITTRDFAQFQDHGYKGLYKGETAGDIGGRKGLKKGQAILDYMGPEELAANLFRATQAEAKLRREGITEKHAANRAHYDVGAAVRRFIVEDLGGTPPEQLETPAESIKQLQAQERRRIAKEGRVANSTHQTLLFPDEAI